MVYLWENISAKVSPKIAERIHDIAIKEEQSESAVIRRLLSIGIYAEDGALLPSDSIDDTTREIVTILLGQSKLAGTGVR